jgi:hypothetical protein
MIKRTLFLFAFLGTLQGNAQNLQDLFTEETKVAPEAVENVFKGTRLVNVQSANLVEPGTLILLIQHRFGDIGGGAYEFFGLDQAEMRLGFEYGLSNRLTAGLGRTTYQKTYDAFVKAGISQQSASFPFAVTFTASGYLPTVKNYFPETRDGFSDKMASHLGFEIVRNFGAIAFQVSPAYMFTGYVTEAGDSRSFAVVTGGLSLAVSKKVNLNMEYIHYFTDMLPENNRPLSIGADIDTGGHLFQLILSNTQSMTEHGIYKRSTGDWTTGNIYFGFNLIRNFYFKQP